MKARQNSAPASSHRARRLAPWDRFWGRLISGDKGQTLVIAALCMVVLMAFLGLAIDVGQMRYEKRQLQMAADAAALAAALEISQCGSTVNCSAMQVAAQDALTENGFTGSSLLTNCGTRTGTKLEISVNDPPCAVTGDTNSGNDSVVEVVVSDPVPTVFARVLGLSSVLVSARAEGAQSSSNCIYALDPSGSGALTVAGFAALESSCGVVDESSSSSALLCELGAISAQSLSVVGRVYNLFCAINPAASTGASVPSPADPLSSLATPSVPACGSSTSSPYKGSKSALTISGTAVLYPTYAYCGGITIKNGAHVTFEPGTYVLGSSTAAGGLAIDVGSTVNGTGVMFYNYGTSGGITFSFTSFSSGGVDLVAPTSGVYSGILFFQNSRNTSQATIIGSSSWNTVLEGTYYFPKAKVEFAFDGIVHYNILVAYDIAFEFLSAGVSTSGFSSDYSSLTNGSPIKSGSGGASIVE